MPHTCCCVPMCANRGNGHRFPRDPKLRKQWVLAIRRVHWRPSVNSLVCKSHFKDSDYKKETFKGKELIRGRLKRDAVPSVFAWTKTESNAAVQRTLRVTKRKQRDTPILHYVDATEFLLQEEIVSTTSNQKNEEGSEESYGPCHVSVQTDPMPSTLISIEKMKEKDNALCHYTGMENYEKFQYTLRTLGPAANELIFKSIKPQGISIENQFLITLIKLRKAMTYYELGILFDKPPNVISAIFVTWINFMYHQWLELEIWPSKDLVQYFSPINFRKDFRSTRIIIDGTEIPIKKPGDPVAQQETWSTYKNHNTLKTLVGCTPGGLVSYIQDAYGGSASDRLLCERGTLMQQCEKGDSIMSDKGFNVQDIFAPHDIAINIPTFMTKKNQLNSDAVRHDRKISQKRVLIERIIGLAKTYKILKAPLNDTEAALGTQIIFVCFMLCNFRSCIVPECR